MIYVGFTDDILVTAPRRADKPDSPWVNTRQVRQHEVFWLPDAAFDDLQRAHGEKVCDMTPNVCSMVWGWTTPHRITLLQVVDCPTCDAGRARRMTVCPMCLGATRVYNL
jgi:hypothetical protein